MNFVPVLVMLAWCFQAATPQPQGLIAGRIVSAQTTQGIGGVQVELKALGGDSREYGTSTAADGTFSFGSLRGGNYSLAARKAGHPPAQSLPVVIKLDEGQNRTGVELKFYRPSIITGHLKDSDGLPLIQSEVTAYRLTWTDGRQSATPAGVATSDDRGEYRISKLPAGRYVVTAAPASLEAPAGSGAPYLTRTFYPSVPDPSGSTPLRLGWDQEAVNIDLELRPQTSYCLAGRVIDYQTSAPCDSCILRAGTTDDGYEIPVGSTGTARDGSYRICGLAPGTYRLSATDTARTSAAAGARLIQITKSDLRDAHVFLAPEQTITGRVLFQSPPDGLELTATDGMIWFRSAGSAGSGAVANVKADSSFEAKGLSPGTYGIKMAGLPPGGYLKEVRLAGRPLTAPQIELSTEGSPQLEAVVGFDAATLGVAVKSPDESTSGSPGTVIALFPADNSSAFLTEIRRRTDSKGSATITGVPPGIYTVYAFRDSAAADWDDPEVRRRYSSYSRSVNLSPGKRENLELSLLPEVPDGR